MALEARVAVLEEYVLANRDRIKKVTCGSVVATQTVCERTDAEAQTNPIRKNVTERGVMVVPTICHAETQTNPPVANRLIAMMSKDVLPLIAQISPAWIKEEQNSQTLSLPIESCILALERIQQNEVRVEDVVLMLQTALMMLADTYSDFET